VHRRSYLIARLTSREVSDAPIAEQADCSPTLGSVVKCMFCGDFPGSLVYCHGWGVDTSQDWFPMQPHAFAFCDRCRGFIDRDDLEGLLGVTGMTAGSRKLREFSASTGLLGPEAPYVSHVIDGAHRVYVLVTATHRESSTSECRSGPMAPSRPR
jgi:hypothetical protein